jgi:hypothetical protein
MMSAYGSPEAGGEVGSAARICPGAASGITRASPAFIFVR